MADTQQEEQDTQTQTDKSTDGAVEVEQAELPEVEDKPSSGASGQVDILLDTAMPLSVRLGQVSMQIRQLLKMGPGSILKLDKQAGEPVDVLLRGIRFATGQLVVAEGRLGVRIEEIFSQEHQGDEEVTKE